MLAGNPGHAVRRFAKTGLAVNTALTGEAKIGAGHFVAQATVLDNNVNSFTQRAGGKRHQSGPQAASGTCAGQGGHVLTQLL